MHQHKVLKRYAIEFFGAFFLYFLFQTLSLEVPQRMQPGIGQKLVLFSPVLPFLLILVAVTRYFWRVDEYLRLFILENYAITAAITFVCTFIYGYFEILGFPKLSMFTICPLMGTVCAAVHFVRRLTIR